LRARLRFYWIVWSALLLTMLIPSLVRRAAGSPEPLKTQVLRAEPPHTHDFKDAVKVAPVWQVEKAGDSEVYSNGLRIDTRFTVLNHPRLYLAFPRDGNHSSGPIPRSQPVGIVYHTTESQQAPFVAQDNRVLMRLGESLLEYVRRERAYHYLIDRFGRVYRVVAESDAANHAGYSVWADDKWLYVNLNDSFFGVSFEAQSHPGQAEGVASPAQIRAAAMLTEMLRSRYQISAENCVTHAQVSVNPSNMQVGYHTDWAAGFPFEALGLPDNYELALPSLWAFGFAPNRESSRRPSNWRNRISPRMPLDPVCRWRPTARGCKNSIGIAWPSPAAQTRSLSGFRLQRPISVFRHYVPRRIGRIRQNIKKRPRSQSAGKSRRRGIHPFPLHSPPRRRSESTPTAMHLSGAWRYTPARDRDLQRTRHPGA
jgi:hypothetical protein